MLATNRPTELSETPLLDNFKALYQEFSADRLSLLPTIYDEEVLFSDPVGEVKGLAALTEYFSHTLKGVSYCRFEFADEVIAKERASLHWNMRVAHPRLRGNQPLCVNGVSLLEFNERVVSHQDFYDMGAMLYEHIPLLRNVIRKVRAKLEVNQS